MLRAAAACLLLLACAGSTTAQTPAAPLADRFGPVAQAAPASPPASEREPIPHGHERAAPERVARDLARLPEPVRQRRDALIAAARSGELAAVAALAGQGPVRPRLDASRVDEAELLWRSQYPESEGREVLAILLDLLDMPFAHIDVGTPNEMYVWPAFAHLPLTALSPPELVELYRLVTAYDYQQMIEAGTWTFFRLGIAPDGTWHYFMAAE